MKRIVIPAVLGTVLLAGCSNLPSLQNPKTPAVVCQDLQAIENNPLIMTEVNGFIAQDPHSAFAVLWGQLTGSCQNGVPVGGVSQSWFMYVLSLLEGLLPLVPALVGAL